MIIDTSALVSMLHKEPGYQALYEAIRSDAEPKLSAASAVELYAVADRRGDPGQPRRVDRLLKALNITVVAFDEAQASIARAAYRDYGKGSGHPAKLNLGDCFSYALATHSGEPLLFVGKDFSHTDITPA